MRLNKRLVELGVCSRRNADKLIEDGRVKVNGKVAVLGEQVETADDIEIDGEIVAKDDEKILIAYNKPRGVVCTESNIEKSEKISDKIKEFGFGKRLFTVGRLDKDSTGSQVLRFQKCLHKVHHYYLVPALAHFHMPLSASQ